MEKENLTPAQFVELDVITSIEPGTPEWLFSFMPDFEEKMRIWRESGFADSFSKQYFSEALAAFEVHIRKDTIAEIAARRSDHGIDMNSKWAKKLWQQACEAQKNECAKNLRSITLYESPVIDNLILSSPIPKIPKTEKNMKN